MEFVKIVYLNNIATTCKVLEDNDHESLFSKCHERIFIWIKVLITHVIKK